MEIESDPDPPDQAELDARRIRNVSRARRAAMRFSSYCLIAAAACGVEMIDLLWRAVRRYYLLHSLVRPTIYLLAAAILGYAAARLLAKSRHLTHEARRQSLPEPTVPPDFSNLSDGSQIVRNLHDMHNDEA